MDVKVKALTTIQQDQMLLPGDAVLVALSGGADSVALLHVLLSLKEDLELGKIAALHMNHLLRGEEADRDENFVRNVCETWKIPLTVIRRDVAQLAGKHGKGIEETGREVRYAALEEAAERMGKHCRIATAHTLSDNIETVLLHVCRGCGLHGLTGIPPVRGRIIRPLLRCSRAEIEEYCRVHHLEFVTDSTNGDEKYTRNRIRLRIVPELYGINPQFDTAVNRMIRRAAEADSLVNELAEQALREASGSSGGYKRALLARQPQAVKTAALHRAAGSAGAAAEDWHIDQLDKLLSKEGSLTLPGKVQAESIGEWLFFRPCETKKANGMMNSVPETEVIPGREYDICNRKFQFSLCSLGKVEKGEFVHKKYLKNALDYDKLCGRLTIGIRKPGDAYHPAGRKAGKSLKKLFNEAHIPLEERQKIPVIRDEKGIVLIPGFGCDQRTAPDGETKCLLICRTDSEGY